MPQNSKAAPRRVNFAINDDDFEVAFLGELGFSTRFIENKVPLSPGQIGYRLHKANVRRVDYRNGESETAQLILSRFRAPVQEITRRHVIAGE